MVTGFPVASSPVPAVCVNQAGNVIRTLLPDTDTGYRSRYVYDVLPVTVFRGCRFRFPSRLSVGCGRACVVGAGGGVCRVSQGRDSSGAGRMIPGGAAGMR